MRMIILELVDLKDDLEMAVSYLNRAVHVKPPYKLNVIKGVSDRNVETVSRDMYLDFVCNQVSDIIQETLETVKTEGVEDIRL